MQRTDYFYVIIKYKPTTGLWHTHTLPLDRRSDARLILKYWKEIDPEHKDDYCIRRYCPDWQWDIR